MKKIVLTKDIMTYVDDVAYGLLSYYNWIAHNTNREYPDYIVADRTVWIDGLTRTLYLHRLIAGVPQCFNVGWKNGNRLDNTFENLVISDKLGKVYRTTPFTGKSEYKGVRWNSYYGVWEATYHGMNIGYYFNEIDAARAYNIKMTGIYKVVGRGRLNRISLMRRYLSNNGKPRMEIK
jgi:hypothetical protein